MLVLANCKTNKVLIKVDDSKEAQLGQLLEQLNNECKSNSYEIRRR